MMTSDTGSDNLRNNIMNGFSGYLYTINNISWPSGNEHLPVTADVGLPSYLVLADEDDDDDWDSYIMMALKTKFDVRPVAFGGYEPSSQG